jgi:hypothetical protein
MTPSSPWHRCIRRSCGSYNQCETLHLVSNSSFYTCNRQVGRIKNSCNRLAATKTSRTARDLEVLLCIFDGQVGLVDEEVTAKCDQMRPDGCWRSLTNSFQPATTGSTSRRWPAKSASSSRLNPEVLHRGTVFACGAKKSPYPFSSRSRNGT